MQMTNFSRALILLAMLSTASGWGLPSNDSLLSSNNTGEVDGARDQRQLQHSAAAASAVTTDATAATDRRQLSTASFYHAHPTWRPPPPPPPPLDSLTGEDLDVYLASVGVADTQLSSTGLDGAALDELLKVPTHAAVELLQTAVPAAVGKRMAALHWLHALAKGGEGHTAKRRAVEKAAAEKAAVEKAKGGGGGGEGGSAEGGGKGGGGEGGSAGGGAGGMAGMVAGGG